MAATDIHALVAAIPTAARGEPIKPEHHNRTRDAVVGLSNLLERGGVSSTMIYSFPPALLPITLGEAPPDSWLTEPGVAAKPRNLGRIIGWLPVTLPHGSRVVSMTVVGRKILDAVPPNLILDVELMVHRLEERAPKSLITIDLRNTNGELFREPGRPSAGANLDIVDNRQCQYYIQASLYFGPDDLQLAFYSFQIECSAGVNLEG